MGTRLEFQALLEGLLGSDQVFFQPKNNVKMTYPCIIYEWDDTETNYADDVPYLRTRRYAVTVIDRNPDSSIPDKVSDLPMSSFNRRYPADQLNHTVYNVYY